MIEFRVNDSATIMGKFGKRDFPDENLATNLDAFLKAIARKRPETVKGKYMAHAAVKTTMGPSLKLDLQAYHSIGGSGQ